MTKQIQDALKMAIEALEFIKDGGFYTGEDDCIQACKEALEQPIFLDECIAEIDAEIERNGGAWVEQPAQEHLCTYSRAINQQYPRKCIHCGKVEGLAQTSQGSEQAPCEQPVAWLYKRENSSGGWYVVTNYDKEHDNGNRNIECYDTPLYTHPAPSWQGLSDDEIKEIIYRKEGWNGTGMPFGEFANAIEQALKEKNNAMQ